MVTRAILSAYSSSPPEQEGRTKIPRARALYDLVEVQSLVADEKQIFLWTKKCRTDVLNLFDGDLAQVAELIQGLTPADYIDSEWCENGKGALAACDAYRTRRQETVPTTGKTIWVSYFVKFAVSKTGPLVLIVSCHL